METQTIPLMEIPEPVKEPTEHPHVIWIPNTFGKKLVIDEAYISVWVLASMFRDGSTPQDLIETYPHAKPAAIYDAISYYLDHTAEVDAIIESNKIEKVLAKHSMRIDAGGFIVSND